MPDSLERILRQSVEDVLETMFFVRSLGEESGDGVAGAEELRVRVSFEGEPSGSLSLSVPGGIARSISADFLGVEEEALCDRQIGEVVCELANMICGSVLSRVESAVTFRLATPSLVSTLAGDGDPGSLPPQSAIHSVLINGEKLAVSLQMRAGVSPTAGAEPLSMVAGGGRLWLDERRGF